MAIGGERHIDDAGANLRDLIRAEAERGDGARPVALYENVGVAD
jgi:hypothetical protein